MFAHSKPLTIDLEGGFQFSAYEIEVLERVFNSFDTDVNGNLSEKEVKAAFTSQGIQMDDKSLKDFITSDTNQDGKITFDEFLKMYQFQLEGPSDRELKRTFEAMDQNGDGFLNREELKLAVENMNQPVTKDALDKLAMAVDKNKDGKISFKEFVAGMKY